MFYNQKKIAKLCPSKRQMAAMESWVQSQSERIQRRFARFKERVEHYWKLYPWLMVVVLCTMISCRSQQIIVPNDTITQTKTQTKTIERDSIYERDSIFVTQWIKGDTVYNDRWHTKYKFLSWCRIDTFIQHDTIRVTQTTTQTEKERYVPGFYKWCTGLFWLLVVGVIVKIVLKLAGTHLF